MNSKETNTLQNSTQQEKGFRINTEHNTPANPEDYCYAVPFKVFGRFSFILALAERGVFVRIDPTFTYACARFNNVHDFNDFKAAFSLS